MELGDQTAGERTERSRLDVILDKLNDVYGEVLEAVEGGGLEQLDAAEKISWWQTFRDLPEPAATDRPQSDC